MAPHGDPYRTLELSRGATLAEVKQAYRRLVKANHPDRAGEAALPRFLAIQAAYDEIVGPDGRARPAGAGGAAASRAGGPGTRRPWDADPDRAGATYRAYGGRPRRPRPTASPPPRSGAGPGPGDEASAGPRPTAEGAGDAGPARTPNKATLGSTSYDGVDPETFEPDWAGASWYGTTSGTYWTLNPKEYADPRKHGPEYQARARRQWLDGAQEVEPQPQARTTTSWWATMPGDRPMETDERPADGGGEGIDRPADAPSSGPARTSARTGPPAATADSPTDTIMASLRAWLDGSRPGVGARVGRAVVGWAPIALGIGWIAGEMTGCGRFSAACDPAVAPISWFAQIAALGALLLVTWLARIATIATIATLAAVIPGAILLLATSDPGAVDAGRTALGGLMIVAWTAGFGAGVIREVRSARRSGPVS
ncbi:MAG: DnaJ domain-containing protein [Candidatus Limnocylindrales bacterium]